MPFGFRAWHSDATPLPINVRPCQCKNLRRATEAAVAGQSEDQPPLGIRAGIGYFGGILPAHKLEAVRIGLDSRGNPLEGIRLDQVPFLCRREELPCPANRSADRVLGPTRADHVLLKILSISRRDLTHWAICAVEVNQVRSGAIKIDPRSLLDVRTIVDVVSGE